MNFKEWIQQQDESWIRNAWDAMRLPDMPMPQIYNYVKRLIVNSNDVSAWKVFLFGLKKLGKTAEADILGNALKMGNVRVEPIHASDYDPRGGFSFDKLKFHFQPPNHRPELKAQGFTPNGELVIDDPAKNQFYWPK